MQLPEAARLVEQDGVGGEGGAGRACAQQPGQHARAPGLQRGQLGTAAREGRMADRRVGAVQRAQVGHRLNKGSE